MPLAPPADEELIEQLENLLIQLRAHRPDAYPAAAQAYLSRWCDDQHGYLRKYFESGSDQPVYELTPATERVLRWLEDLGRVEFVGTESRFLQIFSLLEEIVRRSTEDPELRLAQLQKEKAALDREIDEVSRTGRVDRYSSTQVKERFIKANEEARRLVGDFREVESNFRIVTRRMQERRLLEDASKGDVVGYVIDEDDALRESDQGRSFYAFWRFLISHQKKDELRALLDHVHTLSDDRAREGDYSMLRNVVRHLSDAGEKVVQSNRRLAEQLRRMLEEAHLRENRRVLDLVGEVKRAALAVKADPPASRAFLEVEGSPAVHLPMERPLWQPEEKPSFDHQPADPGVESIAGIDLTGLFDFFSVERRELEERIGQMLVVRGQATLADLLKVHPLKKGLMELLVYLVIATEDTRHVIDDSHIEEITIHRTDRPPRRIAMPRIIFVH